MKTKPPFDGEIHAVSAKNMPDLSSPKREPGWFLGDPTPTRDEAVARIMDDLRPYAGKTLGSIRIGVDEVKNLVDWFDASAPAPASGGVDAVAPAAIYQIIKPYRDEKGYLPDYCISKVCREIAASLSPAATPVSEAVGEAEQSECGFPFCSCAKRGVCAHAKEDQTNG